VINEKVTTIITKHRNFLGCVGALRENTCFLAIYSSILGLLLLTEALIVILAFVAKDLIENDLNNRLDSMVRNNFYHLMIISKPDCSLSR
jgi:hypothetical protein